MKISGVSLKKILKWVSNTTESGFNPLPDLKKGLKLKTDEEVEQIYAYLKQNDYIQQIDDLSPLYKKTTKIISDLNTLKSWGGIGIWKITKRIIIGVIIIVSATIVVQNTNLDKTSSSNDWTGFYYPDKNNISDESTWIIQPGLRSLEECQKWVLFDVSKNNTDFDYECGYKCRYDDSYKMTVCKETLK